MKPCSRAGVVGVFILGLAAVRLGAQVPPGSSPAQAAPASDATASAPAPVDAAKEAEIRKLLEVTDTMKVIEQLRGQIMEALRSRAPDLPQSFLDHLQKEADPAKVVDKLIPIYAKYYSLDDLKAANAFYQSPAGQHLLAAQPMVTQESLAIAKAWGQETGMKAMLEIQNYKQKMSTTPPSGSTAPTPAPSPTPAPQ